MKTETFEQIVSRYLIGAVLALGLTILSYFAVVHHWSTSVVGLSVIVLGLGIVQLVVQLISFLHLSSDAKPYWRNWTFLFTVLTLSIVVVGSLWIMIHLNYRMGMGPDGMQEYMIDQNKEGF